MTTALAKSESAYIAVNGQSDITLQELLDANYGGKMPPPYKLTHVTLPAGGGLVWEIPGVGEEPETSREIVGVILHVQSRRIKYRNPFGVGPKEAPVCKSDDGITGEGDPGGECAECPLSKWNGDQKPECPEYADAYVLLQDRLIPLVITLPATSLKAINDYRTGLFNIMKPVYGVETKFTLQRREAGSNKFSTVVLNKTDTVISPDERGQFRAMGQQIAAYFASKEG